MAETVSWLSCTGRATGPMVRNHREETVRCTPSIGVTARSTASDMALRRFISSCAFQGGVFNRTPAVRDRWPMPTCKLLWRRRPYRDRCLCATRHTSLWAIAPADAERDVGIMNCGLYVPNCGAFGDPHNVVQLAVDAEANGWDGLFLWDHIKPPFGDDHGSGIGRHVVDPWVALAAAAVATDRICLGTAVTPVPRRRPHKLARETASLDRLSNGRVVLGVGSGEGVGEYDQLGEEADHPTRGAMLDEALELITRLWSGTEVDHVGAHYRVEGARFLPGPVQEPRIPIWVGGVWPHRRPMRRAAHWDGVVPLLSEWQGQDLGQLKDCIEFIRRHRTDEGPFDVVYPGITPGDRPDEASAEVAMYREAGVTWWLEAIAPYRFEPDIDQPWDFERLRERVLQGPPPI